VLRGLFVIKIDQETELVQNARVEQIVISIVLFERRDTGVYELEIVSEEAEEYLSW